MEVKPRIVQTQTELGSVPEHWVVSELGDICQIFGRIGFRGYTVDDIVREGDGAISISPSNIQDDKTDFSKCTYISWKKWEESPEIKIEDGDIILVKTGSTVGKVAIVQHLPERATVNPQIVVLKNVTISKPFLAYSMCFKVIQSQLSAAVVGGALPTLSQRQVAKFRFPRPRSKAEQEAIAEALGDADSFIESLGQLLAKKRDLKQGAMQELLTGKKRLQGFSEPWAVSRLGDLAQMSSGGTPPSAIPHYYDGDIPWVSIADMTKHGKTISETERQLTAAGLANSAAKMFPSGTVLYAMYGGRFILRGNSHGGITDVAFRVSCCAFERNRFRYEFVQVAVSA